MPRWKTTKKIILRHNPDEFQEFPPSASAAACEVELSAVGKFSAPPLQGREKFSALPPQ